MNTPSFSQAASAFVLALIAAACGGSALDGGSSKADAGSDAPAEAGTNPPVIDGVEPPDGARAEMYADGTYRLALKVSAHDDGTVVSARVDFPASEPPLFVGREYDVKQHTLSSYPIEFEIEHAAGPGTGEANLVLTDDKGLVSKRKILVTLVSF